MKKILVPCDFSVCAVEAYQFALKIAAKNKGEIHVLEAIELPVMLVSGFDVQPYAYDPKLLRDLEANARSKFDTLKQRYATSGIAITFHVNHEPPTPAIRQFVKENAIDLIVMGTKGTSGLAEYLIGSNTERIVRLGKVPVFAIRKAVNVDTIKKIIFPITLGSDQTELVDKVKQLQAFFSASLEVLWINTPMNFKTELESKSMLKDFATSYALENYHLHVRSDTIEQEAIRHFTKEINGDMIAMATHGRRGLAHHLMGSVAEDVMNHIQCPIWTYSLHQ